MKSAGGYSFGTSSRDSVNRMYVSPACDRSQLRSRGGNYSPGHVYNPSNQDTVGKSQVCPPCHQSRGISGVASGPWFSGLCVSGTWHDVFVLASPCSCPPKVLKNQGSVVFGTSKRMPGDRPRSPGPGAYETTTAIGTQVLSNRPSSAGPSFGRTDRDQASRVFITSRHEKAMKGGLERHHRPVEERKKKSVFPMYAGRNSPGPGAYEGALSSLGRSQVFKNSAPTYGMGTSEKFLDQTIALRRQAQSPGAGQYEREGGHQEHALFGWKVHRICQPCAELCRCPGGPARQP